MCECADCLRDSKELKKQQNQTKCYYNDALIYTHNQSYSGAYFKAGAYTQSSCTGTPGSSESCSAYGEVVIYNVTVTHQ